MYKTWYQSPLPASRHSISPRAVIFGLAAFVGLMLVSAEAQASCKASFCTSGQDINGMHIVTFKSYYTNVTHFNWTGPDGQQHELGANQRQFSYPNLPTGSVEQYAMQACSGGGFLQKSRCATWVYFTHNSP